jgi:hypothetical protein
VAAAAKGKKERAQGQNQVANKKKRTNRHKEKATSGFPLVAFFLFRWWVSLEFKLQFAALLAA